MQNKYYDISPLISEDLAVFPGDVAFSRQVMLSIEKDHLELSAINSSLHIGAHADAPIHYHKHGQSIAERSLDYYLGECQVVSITSKTTRITPDLLNLDSIKSPRVLFKTGSFPNPESWQNDFTALSPELIKQLHKKGVILVGIDTPSIDPAQSKDLESHQEVFNCDMAILEGLVLTDVPVGTYQLIALPLKIKEADASPVRAVLLPL